MYISGVTIKDYLYPAAAATPYAASFNGSNQYLTAPNSANLSLGSNNFTIEAWVNFTDVTLNNNIFYINGNSGSYAAICLYTQNSQIAFLANQTGGYPWTLQIGPVGPTIVNNTWHHVAVTRSSTSIYVFVDGTLVSGAPYSLTGSLYAGTINNIGYQQQANTFMKGYISNVRIVVGTALYTTNFTVPSLPLTAISNTQLLTCNAATLVDGSSNAFTITNNGTVTTTSSTVPSFAGYSNSFNGSNQYLNLTGQNLSTGSFTIEAWVYLTATGTNGHIFSFGTDTSNRYLVFISATNKFNIGTVNGGTYTLNDSTVTPSVSTWYHVAYVRNSGTSYLYVNGNQVGSNSTSINSGTNWAIGFMQFGSASNCYWNGYISNFRVNTTALYTSNFTPPTSQLQNISGTQLLTCNESTIVDNSSNGYTITNNNGVTVSSSTIPFTLPTTPTAVGTGGITVYEIPYVAPITTFTLSALLVGGGGGGGYQGGGGGGGGGVLSATNFSTTVGIQYTVIIGSGGGTGVSTTGVGYNGGNTNFSTLTAIGGGGGGGETSGLTHVIAMSGGSGGGAEASTIQRSGAAGTPGQGYAGGNNSTSTWYSPGGGGGAGGTGSNGTPTVGGNGGPGVSVTFSGTSFGPYGGGGGAGNNGGSGSSGNGGSGGGGAGGGGNGTANTGGGGGGGVNTTGGNGGSGVAILASPYVAAVSSLSGSPTITKSNNNYIYTFTTTGALTYTNNTFLNYAASFNGSSQYLSMPSSSAFNITGDFTAEAWIYNTNVGNGGHIFSIGTNSNQNGYAALRLSFYTQLQVIISTTGTTWALNGGFGPNLSNNTWYHVAVVRIGTAVTLYVNGTGYSVGTLSGSLYAGTVNWIGACYYSGGTGGIFQPFAGYISNARIINGTGIYTSNFTPSTTHLTAVSGTQLLTCQDAALVDNSTNNFTITNNNSVTTTYTTVPFNY